MTTFKATTMGDAICWLVQAHSMFVDIVNHVLGMAFMMVPPARFEDTQTARRVVQRIRLWATSCLRLASPALLAVRWLTMLLPPLSGDVCLNITCLSQSRSRASRRRSNKGSKRLPMRRLAQGSRRLSPDLAACTQARQARGTQAPLRGCPAVRQVRGWTLAARSWAVHGLWWSARMPAHERCERAADA